ncbi:MAG: DUF2846 domain-containing protein [Candidatus Thiodiazotropha sp. (ex Myrtea sp. 'scaly one' KF741663)]|nr:DUF2846 domain-containing protein [Candidatus Thiodiazotropha sp. (ex Myrtea sp. 'scaly one' KF741663)]
MSKIAVTLMLILLSGCATLAEGPSYLDSKPASKDSDLATIYIYRKYAEPTAWGVDVIVNDQKVASLSQQGFTWFRVDPGNVNIKAVWPALSGQKTGHLQFMAKAGAEYYVELTGQSKLSSVMPSGVSGGVVLVAEMGSGLYLMNSIVGEQIITECCRYQKEQ